MVCSCPQETVGGHPEVHLDGPRSIRVNDDALGRTGSQSATTAIWGYVSKDPINAPCGRFVIDGSSVRLLGKPWPMRTYVHCLPESEFCCGAGILDGFKIFGAHCFGRIAENNLG